jgi:hypothetical protein
MTIFRDMLQLPGGQKTAGACGACLDGFHRLLEYIGHLRGSPEPTGIADRL